MQPEDWSAIQLSLLVSATALALFTIPCLSLGIWLGGHPHVARKIINAIVMAPLVLPPVVSGLLLLKLLVLLQAPVYFTWIGAALAAGLVGMPLWIRSVRTGVESIDPRLYVVARSLGASRWRQHRTITLPLMRRATIAGALLFIARTLGEFGAVMVVAGNTPGKTQTIPLAIFSKLNAIDSHSIWPLVAASLTLSVVFVWISEKLTTNKRPSQST